MSLSPWLHIVVAYLIYIGIAVITSIFARKIAGDLRDFQIRNSPRVLLVGAIANILAMIAIVCLLIFWDGRSIASLGLAFHPRDTFLSIIGFLLTFGLAIGYVLYLKGTNHFQVLEFHTQSRVPSSGSSLASGLAVLATVVLQEEVLNRGYIVILLLPLGIAWTTLISTTIFVLIHFLTNRAGTYQVWSWTVSGFILVLSYLMSGSIWVPIILHFATDAANILIFNITGQHSFVATSPGITDKQRAVFRLIYGVALLSTLVLTYGLSFKINA